MGVSLRYRTFHAKVEKKTPVLFTCEGWFKFKCLLNITFSSHGPKDIDSEGPSASTPWHTHHNTCVKTQKTIVTTKQQTNNYLQQVATAQQYLGNHDWKRLPNNELVITWKTLSALCSHVVVVVTTNNRNLKNQPSSSTQANTYKDKDVVLGPTPQEPPRRPWQDMKDQLQVNCICTN